MVLTKAATGFSARVVAQALGAAVTTTPVVTLTINAWNSASSQGADTSSAMTIDP